MIGYLKGKVIYIGAESAIISVGGVGYEVCCSGSAFSKMTQGAECELYTYLQVSEQNGVQLFGFADMREKAMFLKLTSVSGVGPKLGLAVMTYMNADEVGTAIATGDTKRLCQVKGLGKKIAERIVLELKDGMPALSGGTAVSAAPIGRASSEDEDAVVALISLGYSRAEAERAVVRAKQGGAKGVEEIIMQALKGM